MGKRETHKPESLSIQLGLDAVRQVPVARPLRKDVNGEDVDSRRGTYFGSPRFSASAEGLRALVNMVGVGGVNVNLFRGSLELPRIGPRAKAKSVHGTVAS